MANPRKAREALEAEGTYRKDRHEDYGFLPSNPQAPPMPPDLSDETKVIWYKVIDQLEETGYLCKADEYSMTALCEMIADLKRAPREFTAAQYTQLRMLFCEFGMTPASRARMPSGKPVEEGNAFENLLKMSGGDHERVMS